MKRIATVMMFVTLLIGVLTACDMGNDNNMNEQPENINYDPARFNNENGDVNNNNRGPDIDTDPRDVRDPNEVDTPNNMDEEEPDPDEEPSEERRGH